MEAHQIICIFCVCWSLCWFLLLCWLLLDVCGGRGSLPELVVRGMVRQPFIMLYSHCTTYLYSRTWIVSTLKGRQNSYSLSEELAIQGAFNGTLLHEVGTEQWVLIQYSLQKKIKGYGVSCATAHSHVVVITSPVPMPHFIHVYNI